MNQHTPQWLPRSRITQTLPRRQISWFYFFLLECPEMVIEPIRHSSKFPRSLTLWCHIQWTSSNGIYPRASCSKTFLITLRICRQRSLEIYLPVSWPPNQLRQSLSYTIQAILQGQTKACSKWLGCSSHCSPSAPPTGHRSCSRQLLLGNLPSCILKCWIYRDDNQLLFSSAFFWNDRCWTVKLQIKCRLHLHAKDRRFFALFY